MLSTIHCEAGLEKKTPQIIKAMSKLEDRINELGELVSQLNNRLEPVMRPPEPSEDPGKPLEAETPTPLTADLWSKTRHIVALKDTLQDILARLEL